MSIRGIVSGISQTKISINDSQKLCEKYKNASFVRFSGQKHGLAAPFIPAMAGVCAAAMLRRAV